MAIACTNLASLPLFASGSGVCSCTPSNGKQFTVSCAQPSFLDQWPEFHYRGLALVDLCSPQPQIGLQVRRTETDRWENIGNLTYGTFFSHRTPVHMSDVLADVTELDVNPEIWSRFNLHLITKISLTGSISDTSLSFYADICGRAKVPWFGEVGPTLCSVQIDHLIPPRLNDLPREVRLDHIDFSGFCSNESSLPATPSATVAPRPPFMVSGEFLAKSVNSILRSDVAEALAKRLAIELSQVSVSIAGDSPRVAFEIFFNLKEDALSALRTLDAELNSKEPISLFNDTKMEVTDNPRLEAVEYKDPATFEVFAQGASQERKQQEDSNATLICAGSIGGAAILLMTALGAWCYMRRQASNAGAKTVDAKCVEPAVAVKVERSTLSDQDMMQAKATPA
mmetsp:Transcript_3324/g.7968  ORF Transcript_3324/g.7968 Transcript_3324/m.7968 type:complete len:397 (-) Transcript_3324:530-1720(-)